MGKGFMKTSTFWLMALLMAASLLGAPQASAQEAVATSLDSSEAENFMGEWTLSFEFQGNPVSMKLSVVDVDGKAGAVLHSPQNPEPTVIDEIAKKDEGLSFQYQAEFGGTPLNMEIVASREGDTLTGTIQEGSGLFSADLTGKPASAEEDDGDGRGDGDGQRDGGRRRGGGGETKIRVSGEAIRITFGGLSVERHAEDYAKLAEVQEGDVFGFVGTRAPKLFTNLDLHFNGTVIEKENVAPNYPGVYSLWLKNTSDGWNLVFNEEADIWGTQHNPEADVASVPLNHGKTDEMEEYLTFELGATPENGSLAIAWGEHQWTANFTNPDWEYDPEAANMKIEPEMLSRVEGTWNLAVSSQFGEMEHKVTFNEDGTATFESGGETSEAKNLVVRTDEISFDATISAQGRSFPVRFVGELDGNDLEGNYQFNGTNVADVEGHKPTA